MIRRNCFFTRLLPAVLIVGLLFGAGSRLYRSGYRDGFVQGTVVGSADGAAAVSPALYGAAGWGVGGPGGFPTILGFAFAVFVVLMVMSALGRHSRHGHVGPEKQPKDFV